MKVPIARERLPSSQSKEICLRGWPVAMDDSLVAGFWNTRVLLCSESEAKLRGEADVHGMARCIAEHSTIGNPIVLMASRSQKPASVTRQPALKFPPVEAIPSHLNLNTIKQ